MILDIYQKKLHTISKQFLEQFVATSFGTTNVIILGDAQKPKLFLIHGLNSSAPFALDTFSFLVDKFQIVAIDVLGEPNKSDFVRLNKNDASYGLWLLEVIQYFKFDMYSLCGISFGSFPILKSILIDEKKVKEVFLISPAGIINGNILKTIAAFFIPFKKFKKTKKEASLEKCLQSYLDSYDAILKNHYREVFLNFEMDFSLTPNFKKSELSKIKIPITIISSKNDFFVPAKKLKKRCEKNISSLKNFIILKNSKHIPSKKVLAQTFKNITSQNDR